MIQCKFRPIETWPRPWTKNRRNSPFRAGYTDTLNKLEQEIEYLNGRNIVIQLALEERDLRLDGWPRANARPTHPGVIVNFESRHGALQWVCDEFPDHIANLRAIALTMERLRLADLYGVTKGGQQYQGWRAIEPPKPERHSNAVQSTDSEQETAAKWISQASGLDWKAILRDKDCFQEAYRAAAKRHHPDAGGKAETMVKINQAAEVLKVRFGL